MFENPAFWYQCLLHKNYRKLGNKKVESWSTDQSLGYCFMPSCFCLCLPYFQMICLLPTSCFTLNGFMCLTSSDCNVILLPTSNLLPIHQLLKKKFLPQIPKHMLIAPHATTLSVCITWDQFTPLFFKGTWETLSSPASGHQCPDKALGRRNDLVSAL